MKFGMWSRLHRNPARLFELFCELRRDQPGAGVVSEFRYWAGRNSSSGGGGRDVSEEWEKRIIEYAVPSWYEYDQLSDSLCSVFTDINSVFTFMFAKFYRDNSGGDGLRCLVLVSYHPLFEVFPELLQCLSYYLVHPQRRDVTLVEAALAQLALCDRVPPHATLSELTGVRFGHTVLRRTAPYDDQLPGLTQCSPLRELFIKVSSPDTLLFLMAAMLLEKKLLLVAKRLNQLSLSVLGCVSLLYPMSWEHILVPTLSASNIVHIECLVPYVFGLAEHLYEANRVQVDANFADVDFVLVNLDTGDIFMPDIGGGETAVPSLPSSLIRRAKKALKQLQQPAASGGRGRPVEDSHFSQAFLRVNAELLAPLRMFALKGAPFDMDGFLRCSPEGYHPFLGKMCHSQMFAEFWERYLANPEDARYQVFNRAAEDALVRRRSLLPNYKALKKSLLSAAGEGAKRAAGRTVRVKPHLTACDVGKAT